MEATDVTSLTGPTKLDLDVDVDNSHAIMAWRQDQ